MRTQGASHRATRQILSIFEQLFDHQSFTGRSGAFFGYEGLGCIYWHMVSKLLLATQESYARALQSHAPKHILDRIRGHFQQIRTGIGDSKSPEEYGAFPMDPYSHTPASGHARQPGLTGQVKEDILSRFGELGVQVRDGRIHVEPRLLKQEEFLTHPSEWRYFDISGAERRRKLPANSLAFTYCQTPFIYKITTETEVAIHRKSSITKHPGTILDAETSHAIFQRTGEVTLVILSHSNLPA